MGRNLGAVVVIYAVLSFAWLVLGSSLTLRTRETDRRLQSEVAALWGDRQLQNSPDLVFRWPETTTVRERIDDPQTGESRVVTKEREVWREEPALLDSSRIEVDLELDQRRKGLLWYATYGVAFDGTYAYTHQDDREGELVLTYRFPTVQASYDDFRLEVDGKVDPKMTPVTVDGTRIVQQRIPVRRGTPVPFRLTYRSRGLDWWRYSFGPDISRVKDFVLVMRTDFRDIDFSDGTLSPDRKTPTPTGWELEWSSSNLISGFDIGLEMPHRLNPGPLAARISFFAPVCLGFFFAWIFVITLMRGISLHPMNYLFLGAAFFAFHLLFSYTVDHVDVVVAFAVSSIVSLFLVISYLRLVVGMRFAAVEAGISQLIYLVLFSCAHFFEGFTGLVVTIGSILTLFALMQLTGRIDWARQFARPGRPAGATSA